MVMESLNRNTLNLDTLYDRLCSDEKGAPKKSVKPMRDDMSDSDDANQAPDVTDEQNSQVKDVNAMARFRRN